MTYRDDHEALLQRVSALERELAAAHDERRAAQAEVERLRGELDDADTPAELGLTVPTPAPLAPVVVDRRRASTVTLVATGAVAAGWTLLALGLGAAVWMLPAAAISTVAAARLASRRPRVPTRELEARWPGLPISAASYEELLARPRRSVVVRIAVTFESLPSRGDRERLRKRLRRVGATSWDRGELTISSGLLRTGEGKGETWTFAPELVRAYCARVFDALVPVHEDHPIAAIWPRARSS